jgi:hypothetical protein
MKEVAEENNNDRPIQVIEGTPNPLNLGEDGTHIVFGPNKSQVTIVRIVKGKKVRLPVLSPNRQPNETITYLDPENRPITSLHELVEIDKSLHGGEVVSEELKKKMRSRQQRAIVNNSIQARERRKAKSNQPA